MGSNALRDSPTGNGIFESDQNSDDAGKVSDSDSRQRKVGVGAPPQISTTKEKAGSLDDVPLSFDDEAPLPVSPPDGGYGWVIVLASFMNHIIVDGIAFTFGVFLPAFLVRFEAGSAKTALVGSLMNAFYLLTAPFAGFLINRFGCRKVSMAGAVIAALGFSLSALSTSIEALMVTYGVIGGYGLGVLYLPNVVAVSFYFEKRRALATGIAVCGAGVGCFIFAPLGDWLLETYGWQGAMLFVAGIALHGVVFGAMLRPIEELRRPRSRHPSGKKSKMGLLKDKIHPNSPEKDLERQHKKMEKVIAAKLAREDALNAGGSANDLGQAVLGKKATLFRVTCIAIRLTALYIKIMRNSRSVPAVTHEPMLSILRAGHLPKHSNDDLYMSRRKTGSDGYLSPIKRRDMVLGGSTLVLTPAHSMAMLNRSTTMLAQAGKSGSTVNQSDPSTQTAGEKQKLVKKSIKQQFMEEYVGLLMDPKFFIPCLANLFAALGLFIPFVYLVDRAIKMGITENRATASFLLSVVGITNTIGRVLAGFLADFPFINTLALHNSAIILAGVSSLLVMFYSTYGILCAYAAFFGMCIATWISLTSIVLCDLLGLARLTNAFSILTMTRGIATLFGSPMAGSLFDFTQDYDAMFYLCGVAMLSGGVLFCTLHLSYFQPKQKPKNLEANDAENLDHLPLPLKQAPLEEIIEVESPSVEKE